MIGLVLMSRNISKEYDGHDLSYVQIGTYVLMPDIKSN